MPQFPWPHGHRCAVALTFDMDGETVPFVLDPANARRRLSLMSEAMYGPRVGMPRILDVLEANGLLGTFFVPGFTAELHVDLLKDVVARGHHLGHHGYLHERPDSLSDEDEEAILVRGKEILRSISGHDPIGYRSPSWELKPTTPALLARHGFLYDSSLMGDDVPYRVEAGDRDLIELPPQWILDDWPQFGFSAFPPIGNGIADPDKAFGVWSSEFAGLHRFGGLYVMTMHPFVSGRPSRILLLERLIEYMRSFPDVWFTTLEEIAQHCADTGAGELFEYPKNVMG
jgi:peptidoglycan/xylan/chitin deacetylase (PgdA/CDA1 family)